MNDEEYQPSRGGLGQGALWLLFLLLSLLTLPYILVVRPLQRLILVLTVWFVWYPHGIYGVLAYSAEPTSRTYLEEVLIPELDGSLVLVDVSDRRFWPENPSVALQIVTEWLGVDRTTRRLRQRVPAVVLMLPWQRPQVLDLAEAFSFYRGGVAGPLQRAEEELLTMLGLEM